MKKVNTKQIAEAIRNNRKYLFIMIVSIVAMLIFFILFILDTNEPEDLTSFHEIIISDKDSTGKLAKVNVSEIPYAFAQYSNEIRSDKYYFILDENYMYVAYLDYDSYKKLNNKNITDNPITIYGKTKKIPSDVLKLAIDTYNEVAGEEFLTNDNYESYIGNLYLDITDTSTITDVYLFISIIFLIISIIAGVIYIRRIKSIKKLNNYYTDSEWEIIEKELIDNVIISFPKINLYLTDNYLIDKNSGLSIIRYSDIVWFYLYQLKRYGITTNQNIIVYTNDKKKHVIATINGSSKKKDEIINSIVSNILAKNPKALYGYNKENRKTSRDLYGIR